MALRKRASNALTLSRLPTTPPGSQESPRRRYDPRRGHPCPEQGAPQALYAVDEEGEAFFDGLLHPAFEEKRAFLVQDAAAPLVDGAEDGRLEQAPFVFDEQEVDAKSALGRGALEAFDQAGRAGPAAVGQLS